jgi:biotin transport system substrate-specific component
MNSSLTFNRSNLFDWVFPKADLTGRLVVVVGCSWLMALASHLSFPLPFTPVPVTAQTFAVLMLASVLGWRMALASQLLYLFQGLAGLPVFAPGLTWGVARLLGPTGGYLLGFLVATLGVGALADRGWGRRFGRAVLMMAVGECAIYLVAVPWLKWSLQVNWTQSLAMGWWPFLVGDAYKMALAALVLPGAYRLFKKTNSPAA